MPRLGERYGAIGRASPRKIGRSDQRPRPPATPSAYTGVYAATAVGHPCLPLVFSLRFEAVIVPRTKMHTLNRPSLSALRTKKLLTHFVEEMVVLFARG